MNGNIDAGAGLVGQINVGAWWIDINGNELASIDTTALFPPGSPNVAGAKSPIRLGDEKCECVLCQFLTSEID